MHFHPQPTPCLLNIYSFTSSLLIYNWSWSHILHEKKSGPFQDMPVSYYISRENWLGLFHGATLAYPPSPPQFEEIKWHIKFYDQKYLKLLTFHYFYKPYIWCKTFNIFTIFKIYEIFLWNINLSIVLFKIISLKFPLKKAFNYIWIIWSQFFQHFSAQFVCICYFCFI